MSLEQQTMQHMSSKINEHLLHASELFDGQGRYEVESDAILASKEVKEHLKNWSLIGSALRHELPQQIDLNFADKVMAKVAQEENLPSLLKKGNFNLSAMNEPHTLYVGPQVDPEEDNANIEPVVATKRAPKFLSLKRVSIFASQIAIAASVAVVAVVGVQTYNAADNNFEHNAIASVKSTVGPSTGLSLASYQNNDSDIMLNLEQIQSKDSNNNVVQSNAQIQAEIKRQQKAELERINTYVQGYVLDTAANSKPN